MRQKRLEDQARLRHPPLVSLLSGSHVGKIRIKNGCFWESLSNWPRPDCETHGRFGGLIPSLGKSHRKSHFHIKGREPRPMPGSVWKLADPCGWSKDSPASEPCPAERWVGESPGHTGIA